MGFLYGLGAFETMRWYHGVGVFRLERHLRRVRAACEALRINGAATGDVAEAIEYLMRVNNVRGDVTVRLTIAAGDADGAPIRLMTLRDIGYPNAAYQTGAAARSETFDAGDMSRHKTTMYAAYWLARNRAAEADVAETLLFDPEGWLLEGATSNVFIVSGGRLKTPPLTMPILPGITRETVLELARGNGVGVSEENVSMDDLFSADEVFVTNSIAELLPLARVDRRVIGESAPGEVTQRLMKAYRAMVQRS